MIVGRTEHIFFVDDEPALGDIARELPEGLGSAVDVFDGPLAALRAVAPRKRNAIYSLQTTPCPE
ncbi:MAG: hypothetical protein KKB20_12990 [Proteobacteria bacterium]|nr:hypothetical protein [Pseudomonadota bacterium]